MVCDLREIDVSLDCDMSYGVAFTSWGFVKERKGKYDSGITGLVRNRAKISYRITMLSVDEFHSSNLHEIHSA